MANRLSWHESLCCKGAGSSHRRAIRPKVISCAPEIFLLVAIPLDFNGVEMIAAAAAVLRRSSHGGGVRGSARICRPASAASTGSRSFSPISNRLRPVCGRLPHRACVGAVRYRPGPYCGRPGGARRPDARGCARRTRYARHGSWARLRLARSARARSRFRPASALVVTLSWIRRRVP